jgi:D-beta-D-heptose 7-phosphate kinase/D-beta-D-heptose 1-phosphate adenosyltransferase
MRGSMALGQLSTVQRLLADAARKHVLVIGDAILDLDVYSTALGLSLETPTLKAKKDRVVARFGGAGLVVRNALALGAQVTFLTAIGADENKAHYDQWTHAKLTKQFIITNRANTVKSRFWVGKGDAVYKAFQLDTLDNAPITAAHEQELLAAYDKTLPSADVVIIADYRHGLLTPSLIGALKTRALAAHKPIIADSQISEQASNHAAYAGFTAVTLNQTEAQAVVPGFTANDQHLAQLQKQLQANVVVKLGKDGCAAVIDGDIHRAPTPDVRVVDSCGAGDAFLAALSIGDLRLPAESLQLATTWASLSTTIHGTEPASLKELPAVLERLYAYYNHE